MLTFIADIEKTASIAYYTVGVVGAIGGAIIGFAGAYFALKFKVARMADEMTELRKENNQQGETTSRELAAVRADNTAQTKALAKVEGDVRDMSTRMEHRDQEAADSKRERADVLKVLTQLQIGMAAIASKMNVPIAGMHGD